MKNRDFDKFVLIFLIQFFEYALLTFELAIFIFGLLIDGTRSRTYEMVSIPKQAQNVCIAA